MPKKKKHKKIKDTKNDVHTDKSDANLKVVKNVEANKMEDQKQEGQLIRLTQEYINDLPNSSFALIKGEVKDKTKDRALPFKDIDGNVDLDQLKNSLAQLPVINGYSAEEKSQAKQSLEDALVIVEGEEKKVEAKTKDGVFIIQIDGVIGWDVTAEMVKEQMKKADGSEILFEVSSPGGSVFEGLTIFNAIRNYEGKTTAHILGLAASMASYIPLATDYVKVEDNAIFMIHNAWTVAIGDSKEMQDQADFLNSLNTMLSKAYSEKSGKKKKEILDLMAEETWYFGEEIKKMGFADEVIVHSKSDDKESKKDKMVKAKLAVKAVFSKLEKEKLQEDIEKTKSLFSSVEKVKAEDNKENPEAKSDESKSESKPEKVEDKPEENKDENENESVEEKPDNSEEPTESTEPDSEEESTETEVEDKPDEEEPEEKNPVDAKVLGKEIKALEEAHDKLTEANNVIKHNNRLIKQKDKKLVELTDQIDKFTKEVNKIRSELGVFQDKEKQEQEQKFGTFVERYNELMNVPEQDQERVRKELGTFSDAAIELVEGSLDKIENGQMEEPVDDTAHSSQQTELPAGSQDPQVTQGSKGDQGREQKIGGLFEKMQIKSEIDKGNLVVKTKLKLTRR